MGIKEQTSKFVRLIGSKKELIYPLFILVAFFVLHLKPISFGTSDLGRHLKNGEIAIQEHHIISTNYYSYTHTDFEFRTHHWAAGVIFYFTEKWFGFNGLSIINTLFQMLVVLLVYWLARSLSKASTAFLVVLSMFPILLYRAEVRPESISYLFFVLSYVMLFLFDKKKTRFSAMLVFFSVIQIFWVNIHIYFVLNLALVGAFMARAFLLKDRFKQYALLFLILIPSSMVSPFGVYAFIEPFMIFRDFEMQISEMLPIPVIENGALMGNPFFFYFKVIFVVSGIFLLLNTLTGKVKEKSHFLLLFVFFSIMSWWMNRMITVFAYVMIPIAADSFKTILMRYGQRTRIISYSLMIYLILMFFLVHSKPMFDLFGIGLSDKKINEAAYFFKRNKIPGPLLNNMNSGSYLIYHLFPKYKVFYDARPEAYPGSFVRDVYRPILQDEEQWKLAEKEYGFKSIFFYLKTMTEYEKDFLGRRINDPSWKPVYNDGLFMILIPNR